MTNDNNGIKEPTHGHRKCSTGKYWWKSHGGQIFGYLSYYLGQSVAYHIDTKMMLPTYENWLPQPPCLY